MSKIYQPIVIKRTDEIITFLKESGFFSEFQIENTEYAKKYMSDILTTKLIEGKINMEYDEIFTEEEFDKILVEITAGSYMHELKKKGMVDSYEDDETEERFFLTEMGLKMIDEIKKNNNSI